MRLLLACCALLGLAAAVPFSRSPGPRLGEAPVDFDCKMRNLAMEFARTIQPFRSSASFEVMAAALREHGGSPGGETQCFNITYDGPTQVYSPVFPIPDSASEPSSLVFFVDAERGDDGAMIAGDISSPFQTIGRAVEAVRKTRAGADLTPATIVLRGGVHYLEAAIELGAADSHITFQNYQTESAVVSGGRRLSIKKWTPVMPMNPNTNNDVLIYRADLKGQHIKEISGLRFNRERAVRARYPNGCASTTEPTPSGYLCQGVQKGNRVVDPNDGFGSTLLTDWVFPVKPTMNQPNWTEYHPATPVRTTGGSFQRFQLGIGGTCDGYVPPAGYWCSNTCEGGAPAPPDCIARWPEGLLFNDAVLPNGPYKNLEGAIVQAWHPYHWESWMFSVDAAKSNSSHIMFSKGGFQGARGAYPDLMADSFFIENVKEELDADNEFYYDVAEQALYFASSAAGGPPVSSAEMLIEATNLKSMWVLKGDQSAPVKSVSLLGLTLRDASLTYMDAHAMPSGGDWGLGRLAAVIAYGVEDVVIDSCTFEMLDGNAVFINGYARDVIIQNNDFHEIGDNMIAVLGETTGAGEIAWGMGWDGTEGNQPQRTIIRRNFAYRCGLFEKQSSFFFQGKSHHNMIQHNIFFHGPRAGINYNDGMGGGSILEGNLLFSTVMESGDHGPFNSWDRQVYAHERTADGGYNIQKDYDEIRYNFFVGNYYGQENVDNDDGSAYYETHHNFFAYGAIGMKNDYNGHDNHHHHNVYAYADKGLGICGAFPNHADKYYSNWVIQNTHVSYADYDCNCANDGSCPELRDNLIYTPDGTMDNICSAPLKTRQAQGMDVGTIVLPYPTADEIISLAREVLDMPTPATKSA